MAHTEVKNWVITGGCGFVAMNLVNMLRQRDDVRLRLVDDQSDNDIKALSAITELDSLVVSDVSPTFSTTPQFIEADICDRAAMTTVLQGADIVVHLAAKSGIPISVSNPELSFRVNSVGTFNLLEAARQQGVKKFIFASSGAVTGNAEPPIHELTSTFPISPYGASKLAGESFCQAYFHSYGMETTVLRFSNVYGPRSAHKTSVVANFLKSIAESQEITIYGDGEQSRDFIYIEDLLQAIVAVSNTPAAAGEIFQIATGEKTSINQLVQALSDTLATKGMTDIQINYKPSRQGDVFESYFLVDKAKHLLGWEAKTAVADGIHHTVTWFSSK